MQNAEQLMTHKNIGGALPPRLVEVPRAVEATLQAFIQFNPHEGFAVAHVLWFRRRVAEEFERLVSVEELAV